MLFSTARKDKMGPSHPPAVILWERLPLYWMLVGAIEAGMAWLRPAACFQLQQALQWRPLAGSPLYLVSNADALVYSPAWHISTVATNSPALGLMQATLATVGTCCIGRVTRGTPFVRASTPLGSSI
jgi:hypothetical protein